MRQFNFVKPAALRFDGEYVSDHNRSALGISYERIENRIRTQGGGMRKYYRADKRTIDCSWEQLPETDQDTVDFGMGAKDLETFFKQTSQAFPVQVTFDTGVTETYTMVFEDFSIELQSRLGDVNLYTVQLSLEEV